MISGEASIEISARADLVYDLVADVAGTPDHSPECRRIEWIGEPGAVVGARFRGRNRWRGFAWWRNVKIIQADRGREFAFRTEPGRGIYNDTTIWRYRFEVISGDTIRVTESYQLDAPWWLQAMDTALGRPRALRRSMNQTLSSLKHTAEQVTEPGA